MVFGDPRDVIAASAPNGVRVADDVPANRPSRFITVEYLPVSGGYSGVKARVLSKRRMLIYCWGSSIDDARAMCETLRDNLLASRVPRRVDIVGEPSRRDDVDSGHRRFVMTVDLVLRSNP